MEEHLINRALQVYGRAPHGGNNFRVVWSDKQLENRHGTYNEFTGALFVRTFVGVREVPKYPFIKERWVLERWAPPSLAYNPELPDSTHGSYEPVFVYQTENGEYLPLNEEITLKIVQALLHPLMSGDRASRDRTEAENNEAKQYQEDLDLMEEASPYLAGKLHGKEAIIVPEKKYENNTDAKS